MHDSPNAMRAALAHEAGMEGELLRHQRSSAAHLSYKFETQRNFVISAVTRSARECPNIENFLDEFRAAAQISEKNSLWVWLVRTANFVFSTVTI